jgi:excinuclease ABC subunit B
LAQKVKYDLEMIQEIGYVNGIENYSRYFDGRQPGEPPFTLLDYFAYNAKTFDNTFLTIVDESHITIPQLRGMYRGDQSRKQTLIDYGFRLPSALDNRPLKFDEILARLPQVIYASATPQEWELNMSRSQIAEQLIRPTGLVDPEIEIRPIKNQIPDLVKEIILRVGLGQRALVTTLTKRTAEALTEYLNDPDKITSAIASSGKLLKHKLPQVQYLHADINTLDRSDILDSLRSGEFDVVVGINLLREGLDLPEVSLVAILEADKEGFLRSKTSLIQTMGRAARHQEGKVIMYADRITNSMRHAISEVDRRRRVQLAYNRRHHITPQSIKKPIRSKLLIREQPTNALPVLASFGWESLDDIRPENLTPKDKASTIKQLSAKMRQAAKNWDFEAAAAYRDALEKLRT